jgi:hypothetical protein
MSHANLTDTPLSYYLSLSNAGGTRDPSGAWSGMVAELVAGRADVVLFPLTRLAARLEVRPPRHATPPRLLPRSSGGGRGAGHATGPGRGTPSRRGAPSLPP